MTDDILQIIILILATVSGVIVGWLLRRYYDAPTVDSLRQDQEDSDLHAEEAGAELNDLREELHNLQSALDREKENVVSLKTRHEQELTSQKALAQTAAAVHDTSAEQEPEHPLEERRTTARRSEERNAAEALGKLINPQDPGKKSTRDYSAGDDSPLILKQQLEEHENLLATMLQQNKKSETALAQLRQENQILKNNVAMAATSTPASAIATSETVGSSEELFSLMQMVEERDKTLDAIQKDRDFRLRQINRAVEICKTQGAKLNTLTTTHTQLMQKFLATKKYLLTLEQQMKVLSTNYKQLKQKFNSTESNSDENQREQLLQHNRKLQDMEQQLEQTQSLMKQKLETSHSELDQRSKVYRAEIYRLREELDYTKKQMSRIESLPDDFENTSLKQQDSDQPTDEDIDDIFDGGYTADLQQSALTRPMSSTGQIAEPDIPPANDSNTDELPFSEPLKKSSGNSNGSE